jgi:hypothetical protein
MKYLSVKTIEVALNRIVMGDNTFEHRTGTAANSLVTHYFPLSKFTCTPEQIQDLSNKKPDLSIERLCGENLVPHCFVELKSVIRSNFGDILDQLYDTILNTVDIQDGLFSTFVIAMKGTEIAFFQFYSYVSLLDEYNIVHYKGFIPLNQLISAYPYGDINDKHELIDYLKYISKYTMATDSNKLSNLGVKSTHKIPFPHIWNLLNKDHENHVHELFMNMANNIPGTDIE